MTGVQTCALPIYIYRKIGGKVRNGLAKPKKRFRFYENHSGFGQLGSVAFQLERAQKLPRGCEFFVSECEKLCIMIVLMYLNHQNTIYCRISISARVLVLKSPAKLFRATGRSTPAGCCCAPALLWVSPTVQEVLLDVSRQKVKCLFSVYSKCEFSRFQ